MNRGEFIRSLSEREWKKSRNGTSYINAKGYNVLYMRDSNDERVWSWRITPQGNHDPSLDEWSGEKYSTAQGAMRAAAERLAGILDLP